MRYSICDIAIIRNAIILATLPAFVVVVFICYYFRFSYLVCVIIVVVIIIIIIILLDFFIIISFSIHSTQFHFVTSTWNFVLLLLYEFELSYVPLCLTNEHHHRRGGAAHLKAFHINNTNNSYNNNNSNPFKSINEMRIKINFYLTKSMIMMIVMREGW